VLSRCASAIRRAGSTRWFAAIGRNVAPVADRVLHKLSGGRLHIAESFLPTLLLIHTGRRTGARRETPLAYLCHGDALAVAASNWGQAHHPAWSENLLANPEARVELSGGGFPVSARLADESERGELWPRFLAMWPAYAAYAERAESREIRLFVLEPRD
jgi:deazaflavin-dependent oxidoreductase (nitroreductase family)